MVTRRGFMKLAGLGVGALLVPRIAKAQMEEDMTIHCNGVYGPGYRVAEDYVTWEHEIGSALHYPGVIVGVSIFSPATVVSMNTTAVSPSQDFTFLRADTQGSYRSEIWYIPNYLHTTNFEVEILLSSAVDFNANSIVYNYFGGIGYHDGLTGVTSDPAQTQLYVLPTTVNSVSFANLCVNAVGGTDDDTGMNLRWKEGGGTDNWGAASDYGPDGTSEPHLMRFLNNGAGDIWALSVCELLDYQSTPPAIMGF